MDTLTINYHRNSSELCEIGALYDTDKSSQRRNVSDTRHCHPYTLFYDSLFKSKRNEVLTIGELGILDGASLRMWRDYFPNASLYGFEYNTDLIKKFMDNDTNERVTLTTIDVTNKDSIIQSFRNIGVQYDIIIEDTTHQFEDQIRVIENMYSYVKPGGVLIIEDIFKSYNEEDYFQRLQHVLPHFQDYYFVELDHVNRNSTGWDNDKLFILVKGGAEPMFKSENKLTIITPSYRTNNLLSLKNSIDFNYVDKWMIVYDGSKIKENPRLFGDNPKITEYVYEGEGISGNPQRNFALTQIDNPHTMLYYLDDDNIIHPKLYRLLNIIDSNRMYTFNQLDRIRGDNVVVGGIDTAMALIPYQTTKDVRWIHDRYEADGFYLRHCYEINIDRHVYVDNDLCYYNKLSS